MPSTVVRARGHEHVAATHGSTLELTSDDFLTPAGDCIVGIEADLVPAAFDAAFVSACRDRDASIELVLEAGGCRDVIAGRGDPELSFEGDRSLVCRTSDYVDDRTVMLEADAAAADLDRDLVAALADGADLVATLVVE
jgi:hypothetical protein